MNEVKLKQRLTTASAAEESIRGLSAYFLTYASAAERCVRVRALLATLVHAHIAADLARRIQ